MTPPPCVCGAARRFVSLTVDEEQATLGDLALEHGARAARRADDGGEGHNDATKPTERELAASIARMGAVR